VVIKKEDRVFEKREYSERPSSEKSHQNTPKSDSSRASFAVRKA
jgi:hypothetical protein